MPTEPADFRQIPLAMTAFVESNCISIAAALRDGVSRSVMLSMPLYHIHVYWKCGRSLRRHPIRRNSMSTLSMSKFRAILLAITFAGAPLCPASHAQDLEGAVVVNVPFAFDVSVVRSAPATARLQQFRTAGPAAAPTETHFRPPIAS